MSAQRECPKCGKSISAKAHRHVATCDPGRDEKIRKLYAEGLSVRSIGTEVGLDAATVSRLLGKLGVKTRPSKSPTRSKPRATSIPFPDGVSPGGSLADGVCIYCRFTTTDGARLLDHLAEEHGVPREKPAERALRCRECGAELVRGNVNDVHVCEKVATHEPQ